MMNVLYLPMPDRVPDTARKQLQHRANHSANCTFWLRQHRAVMQRFRSNVMDIGPLPDQRRDHHGRRDAAHPVATGILARRGHPSGDAGSRPTTT